MLRVKLQLEDKAHNSSHDENLTMTVNQPNSQIRDTSAPISVGELRLTTLQG